MLPRARPFAAVAVVTALMLAGPARAAVALPISVEALARGADLVVQGRVVRVDPHWTEDHRHILTYAEVKPQQAWRGKAPQFVTVVAPGGRLSGIRQQVDAAPMFTAGEEVVLFLVADGGGRFRVKELALGKFTLTRGRAAPDLSNFQLVPGYAVRKGERRVEEMAVEELRRRVRRAG